MLIFLCWNCSQLKITEVQWTCWMYSYISIVLWFNLIFRDNHGTYNTLELKKKPHSSNNILFQDLLQAKIHSQTSLWTKGKHVINQWILSPTTFCHYLFSRDRCDQGYQIKSHLECATSDFGIPVFALVEGLTPLWQDDLQIAHVLDEKTEALRPFMSSEQTTLPGQAWWTKWVVLTLQKRRRNQVSYSHSSSLQKCEKCIREDLKHVQRRLNPLH